MKLAVHLGYPGLVSVDPITLAVEAERLGYHSVWTGEAYGFDALTLLAWIGARTERIALGTGVLQMPARTPTATAMAAAGLDALTGGRVIIGLGLSNPRVAETWYGVRFYDPLGWTREYIAIVRQVLARHRASLRGNHYTIPLRNHEAPGLRLMNRPHRFEMPIFLASLGPRNVMLAGEIADGWLPVFYSPYRAEPLAWLREGFARGHRDPSKFEIAPIVMVSLGDDIAECRDTLRPVLALWVALMGSNQVNFYRNAVERLGYSDVVREIGALYEAGRRREAIASVPDRLVDEVSLCGPRSRVADGIEAWRAAGATTLVVSSGQSATLRALAEMVL